MFICILGIADNNSNILPRPPHQRDLVKMFAAASINRFVNRSVSSRNRFVIPRNAVREKFAERLTPLGICEVILIYLLGTFCL